MTKTYPKLMMKRGKFHLLMNEFMQTGQHEIQLCRALLGGHLGFTWGLELEETEHATQQ